MITEGAPCAPLFCFRRGPANGNHSSFETADRADRYIVLSAFAALLLALSFLIPEHYLPWDTYRSQALAALWLFALGAAALLPPRGNRYPADWNLPVIATLPLCLAVVPWLQWGFGMIHFFSDALLPSLYLLGLALSIAVGARWAVVELDGLLKSLTLGLLLACTASSFIAIAQFLQVNSLAFMVQMPDGSRAGGNLAQPNHLATLLIMGLCFLLLAIERKWMSRVAIGVLALLYAVALVTTLSRTGALSALLLVLAATCCKQRLGLRTPAWALLVWAAVAVGLVFTCDAISMVLQPESSGLADRLQPGTRKTHWLVMWDAVRQAPWSGYGWNQVTRAQQVTAHLHPVTGELLPSSHNTWLDLWVWIGLPAGTLAGCWLTVWFVKRWLTCKNATQTCLLGAITAVLVHAMFEYPLEYAYFLLPMGLMIGMVDGSGRPSAVRIRAARSVPALAMLGAGALLVWISAEYIEVEKQFRDARVGLLGFNNRAEIVPAPDVVLLDGLREYHRLMITPAAPQMSLNELTRMGQVAGRFPFPPAQLRYALAAGLNGRPDEAARTLRALCAVHPAPRCTEGRSAWAAAQAAHPNLREVSFPDLPQAATSH